MPAERIADVQKLRGRPRAAAVIVALAIVLLAQSGAAASRAFMWKATGHGGAIYLVGSVHLLTADYYPLNPSLETAFRDSDLLVEEVDLAEMLAPGSQLQILMRGMLPADQSLDTVLSPATFAQVSKRVTDLGMPIEPLKRFKPWMLSLTLLAQEWQKAGFDADLGLDKHFYDLAQGQQKPVQGLETPAYQIGRFDSMTYPEQDRMLASTLQGLDTEMSNARTLSDAWRAGDAATVERIVLKDLKQDPAMYQRLLVERNRNWLPKLDALFGRRGRAFVVVGAAHLVGPDGLLSALRARGFGVEQM